MTIDLTYLVIGLILLWGGAEILVKYAVKLSQAFGISSLVIGLTVVSIGTSIPELVVSSVAAWQGKVGISIGNIIGSNIANIALILGVGAVITPLQIRRSWITQEVPYMILVTAIFALCAYTGFIISRPEGLVMLGLLAIFMLYVARFTLREMSEFREIQRVQGPLEGQSSLSQKILYAVLALLGVGVLLGGSNLAVNAGTRVAEHLGVSHSVIGLTLIAIGTSLPELATTIVSASRKAIDLAVGNVIGSNIFNLAMVGGVTSLIHPIPLAGDQKIWGFEFPLLIILSVLVWPLMRYRWNLQRHEGTILLSIYILFIYFTV